MPRDNLGKSGSGRCADAVLIASSTVDEHAPTLRDREQPSPNDIGEFGIIGVAAAIANAVYPATGRRIRALPITIEFFDEHEEVGMSCPPNLAGGWPRDRQVTMFSRGELLTLPRRKQAGILA